MRSLFYFLMLLLAQFNQVALAVTTVTEKVIPSLTKEPVGVVNYIQMFFGLFIIVALIFGMAWFMRRMSNISGIALNDLKVLGGISVGQRERVVLIQAGETQLLIGVAPGEIRKIHVLDEPIVTQMAENTTGAGGFAEKLHAAIKNRGKA